MPYNYHTEITNQFSELIKLNAELQQGIKNKSSSLLELIEKYSAVCEASNSILNKLDEWKKSISLAKKVFTNQSGYRREIKKMFLDYRNNNIRETDIMITDKFHVISY